MQKTFHRLFQFWFVGIIFRGEDCASGHLLVMCPQLEVPNPTSCRRCFGGELWNRRRPVPKLDTFAGIGFPMQSDLLARCTCEPMEGLPVGTWIPSQERSTNKLDHKTRAHVLGGYRSWFYLRNLEFLSRPLVAVSRACQPGQRVHNQQNLVRCSRPYNVCRSLLGGFWRCGPPKLYMSRCFSRH